VTIGVTWPSRGRSPAWKEDHWVVLDPALKSVAPSQLRPLLRIEGSEGVPERDPWYVVGDPMDTLTALKRTHQSAVQLLYIDVPRLETNAADFPAGDANGVIDTWLTVIHALVKSSIPLLAKDGVIAMLCGAKELPFIQLLLSELGPDNYIGTVVWQKGYAPRNMKNMTELSPSHDNIVLFAIRRSELSPVALQVPPEGFDNPDGDPRGPWKAEQKGANKPDCNYDVHVPPYRFSIAEGALPPGIWRINPFSGVIWGPEGGIRQEGTWSFRVRVEDSEGNGATRRFSIRVGPDVDPPKPSAPSWLVVERDDAGKVLNAPSAGGVLKIVTRELPSARLGTEYSACIEARGGSPFVGTTRPGKTSATGEGRYWEFPEQTLLRSASRDEVDFKKKPDAIPAPKKYLGSAVTVPLNQTTLWLNVKGDLIAPGYSQDAKKELEALFAAGVVTERVSTAKPLNLAMRLVALFSREGGCVVDVGSAAAELATAAVMTSRRAVYIELPGSEEVRLTVRVPRLALAVRGGHPRPGGIWFSSEGADAGAGRFLVASQPILKDTSRGICVFALGPVAAEVDRQAGAIVINYDDFPTDNGRFFEMLASLEGLVSVPSPTRDYFAQNLDGRIRAAYVPSADVFDFRVLDGLKRTHGNHLDGGGHLRIYYHRGEPPAALPENPKVEARRIPFDLRPMAGVL